MILLKSLALIKGMQKSLQQQQEAAKNKQ